MMLLLILLQISVWGATGADTGGEETVCTSNACFTFHIEGVSFEDARMKCVDNGGYLVTTKDKAEEAELQSILTQIDLRNRNLDYKCWIGLQLHKGDCIITGLSLRGFKWISGSETSQYSNWEKEPRSTCTEERCVLVYYSLSGRNDLKWTDGSCKEKAFYACKFYFKGMCKPLLLAGGEQVNYKLPFSANPLNEDNNLTAFPFGTYAEIRCNGNDHFSICKLTDGVYGWTIPGPFCATDKQSCGYKNGGCDHVCFDSDPGGIRCGCKDGYVLGQDRVSCDLKEYCHSSPCQYQCVTGQTGFSCVCPSGFQLDKDQFGCIDVDECQMNACDGNHCVNTQGSYTCKCNKGYRMVEGKCHDIDECTETRCPQICLNSEGSFSCHCIAGFTVSEDGHTCIDIDECLSNRCEDKCTNTIGSFMCSCHQHFRLHPNGITCIRDVTVVSTVETSNVYRDNDQHDETIDTITISKVELQNEPQFTDGPPQGTITQDITREEPSSKTTGTSWFTHNGSFLSSWLFIGIIASLVPLLLLIAVTSGIVMFRCSRSKREARKKIATADSYCWVASGIETQLEKFDGSLESTA
ncbi:complement component C1q receptor [Oncorhynchus kisutch]|uniref:complement component C1q receptor n=1 Tax=Oncorhynchus kisutch TaxID=8019 RepID=UPI00099FBF15|nr:complement component C1q receptor [Oncorhynchus kisutch]